MPAFFGTAIRNCRIFAADQGGNIAILSAVFGTVIMGFAALGIDVGKIFLDRRAAQGATDLAALAAVTDLPNASKAASATLVQNKYGNPDVTVELGVYTADLAIPSSQRFKPTTSSPNAAHVTLKTVTPLAFAKVFTGKDSFPISTGSIATQSAFATFAIGSRLASLNGGMLNAMLGGLLGVNLGLSLMDYNALASANIDVFGFLSALASRASVSAVTYNSLLSGKVSRRDIAGAMVDAARAASAGTGVVTALNAIYSAMSGASDKIPISALVNVGPYGAMQVGDKPKVGVSVGALDLLNAYAQLANGQHQVEIGLDLGVPGIADTKLLLAIGERPQGTSWVNVGLAGATVHTAQTRLLLTVTTTGLGAIVSVNVPIYLELASATAQLTKVTCPYSSSSSSGVSVDVTPSLIDAWVGSVSKSNFSNFSSSLSPQPATLVGTPLLSVTGRAHVAVTNMSATQVTFSAGDIAAQLKKTVGTNNFSASLISNLLRDTNLAVTGPGGMSVALPGATTALVGTILANAAAPIDTILSQVLQTLGVGLGQADVWVTGLRCDGAVLVN